MGFSIGFDIEDTPKFYYINNPLKKDDISYIEVKPNKDDGTEWIYLRFNNDEFAVDENDIEKYNDKGRKEAYAAYQEKFEKLGLNAKLFGEWAIINFNENTRTDLVKNIKKETDVLLTKIKNSGYTYEKDEKGRQIISNGSPYKIVIFNRSCMVVNSDYDFNTKTGYLYIAEQDTCGYTVNGDSQVIYNCGKNTILAGDPTLEQYAEMNNIKKWYDDFKDRLQAKTELLQLIK